MRKKIVALLLVSILGLSFASPVSAIELTDKQKSAIINSCSTLKTNLKSVQHLDARTRTYYGKYYETIFTSYMLTLNTRLVKNSISNPDLTKIQSDFASARSKFVSDYVSYSKSFEELVATDCANSPSNFYDTLKNVQEKRTDLTADIKKLSEIITNFRDAVVKLKDSYGKN